MRRISSRLAVGVSIYTDVRLSGTISDHGSCLGENILEALECVESKGSQPPIRQWFQVTTRPNNQSTGSNGYGFPVQVARSALSKKAKRVVQNFRRRGYIRVPIISNVAIRHSARHLMPVLQRCPLLYFLTHACVSVALGLLCFSSCFCLFLSSTPVLHRSP